MQNSLKEKEDNLKEKEKEIFEEGSEIQLSAPLAFWFGFLILGVIIELAVTFLPESLSTTSSALGRIANYILFLPGSIIFPLLVSIWIGERVGKLRHKIEKTLGVGFINAIYTSIIYTIGIFIIFIIIGFFNNPAMTFSGFITNFIKNDLTYNVVIPIIILLVLTPIFAIISTARRK